MNAQTYDGADQAAKVILANTSPRYRRLEGLESWVTGTQYLGKQSWWDPGPQNVPLWERKPCVVYPVAKIAIESNVDLVLGEGRFPAFSAKPGEEEADETNGLGEDDSQKLDRFLAEHHRLCAFRSHCREAFSCAQACGTVVAIHGARNGKPFADLTPAKQATPKFDAYGSVISLEIRYPYLEEYRQPNGNWAVRVRLYRRVIDESADTTFLPADAQQGGAEPNWQADPARTVAHNLGFCPVVWYAFMKGCAPVNQIDGHAIHELVTDEIHQHDIAISQRHRCALLSEPQICEIGVAPGHNPTATGRTANVAASENGGPIGPNNPARGHYSSGGDSQEARVKGPGIVWQYPSEQTKVQALTIGSDALKAQDDNAKDLLQKLQDALGVVFLDPNNIKFAATTSGKALEAIKQKQIDRCDQYRDDLRDNFLLPSVDMQLRIAQRAREGLRVPGIKEVLPLLDKFAQPNEIVTDASAAA